MLLRNLVFKKNAILTNSKFSKKELVVNSELRSLNFILVRLAERFKDRFMVLFFAGDRMLILFYKAGI